MKLIFINSGTGENPWLEDTASLCQEPDVPIEVFQVTSEDLNSQEELFQSLLSHCKDCSFLIVNCHADTTYFKKIDRLLKVIREKLTIGIIFHQSTYIRNELLVINALIAAIESKGMNSLTIFLNTAPDPVSGSLGIKSIVQSYLMKDGTR